MKPWQKYSLSLLTAVPLLLLGQLLGFSGPEHLSETEKPAVAKEAAAKELWPVRIRKPDGPPRVVTDERNALGQPVTVSCASCHTTRQPNRKIHSGEELNEFHQGLAFAHGSVSCLSCHNEENYDTLRLANGETVAYEDVMKLCAQCHGPQYRDYQHGSHGGMTGYWDRTRGPRQRNNCVDCHDPHAPAYAGMIPATPPQDRFLTPGEPHTEDGDSHE